MRYLTLAAGHLEPSVTDAAAELSSLDDLGLSTALTEELRSWNARYQWVVPLPVLERAARAAEIERLDEVGLELAGRIAAELAPAKVNYYSEGLLRIAGQRTSDGQGNDQAVSQLLPPAELPADFDYPAEFLRVVDRGLVDLEPWLILQGEDLLVRHHGLRARYPERRVVPFALRTDRDDVACWDLDVGVGRVTVLGDFEVPGYEQGEVYPTFYAWFRAAVEDFVAFDDLAAGAAALGQDRGAAPSWEAAWTPTFGEPGPAGWVAFAQAGHDVRVLSAEPLSADDRRWLASWLSHHEAREPDVTASYVYLGLGADWRRQRPDGSITAQGVTGFGNGVGFGEPPGVELVPVDPVPIADLVRLARGSLGTGEATEWSGIVATTQAAEPFCRVCGYRPGDPPWGDDGRSPSFEHCPCCGVEWGYQDASPVGVERFRARWLTEGAPWRSRKVRPDGLATEERLGRVGVQPSATGPTRPGRGASDA